MDKLKVEFLISAMNQKDFSIVKKSNIKSDALLINQTDYEEKSEIQMDDCTLRRISTQERGLSKSRNLAIENALGDICVICDDDFFYNEESNGMIEKAYRDNPEADVVVFAYHSKGQSEKSFFAKKKKLGYLNALRVSSCQITFRRKSIKQHGIKFNEDFGSGSLLYKSGEEHLFLFECLKKNLAIHFDPSYLLTVDFSGASTWFNGFDKKFFYDRGAIFTALSNKYSWLLILQFAIRKYRLYSSTFTFFQAVQEMWKGRNDYLGGGKDGSTNKQCPS
ncbi:glycosyltransferase family 2 protein [Planococcus liqunii]|uniref:Glycosyltransferase family 2 protein n=1 Tax=Planococcus liqunii TaxID=3058394 RepID=A0ABT8MNC7_9BACL|nr:MULTISPECIES: glycosyltransferase family 2 protein [unclassified Planococcus (in: firmicutes)]MDN7226402.1 glycosyltransferase family 2 protein [Planococcus sp. N064]WKA50175.1 glycosyltransferase family 2 protein [Planococcus sp. N056]